VPLISLGYMCVEGWKKKLYNPAGIKVITREYYHEVASALDFRGGTKTADHVDILGNYALTVSHVYYSYTRTCVAWRYA
jgi:phospholipid:diacylglycerol acyltransferase